MTDKQTRAVSWLIKDLVEHERASQELKLKMSTIFDSWWESWTGFSADDMSVELPDLEIPDEQ